MVASLMSGSELVLVVVGVVTLFVARKLPEIARGIGEGFFQFRKATGDLRKEFDEGASDAGRSLGGIYGKPAVEALTPDNQTAELYDPAVFRNEKGTDASTKRGRFRNWRLWRLLARLLFQAHDELN